MLISVNFGFKTFISLFVFYFLFNHTAFSEGTKQLAPTQADELKGNLQIFDNNTITRPFMSYASDSSSRLYIHVCSAGEKIYLGFKQTDNDVYFRLKDPNGNIVIDTTKIPNTNGSSGYINSYNEAVAGPRQIVGASGYLAIQYTPLLTGDYYIEVNPKQAGKKADAIWVQKRVFTYFDITVANGNTILPGRLWSRQWDINCNSGTNQFKCSMFIYSNDGIVTSIDFNGIQPYGFTIACNASGVTNTGSGFTDRQSVSGNVNYPSYKIFLNNPDNICYPTGVFGGLTGQISISGCDPKNRCINIPVDKAGNANVILDLNGVAGYQPGTSDRLISTVLKVGNNCVPWDSKDGLGNPVTPGTTLPIQLDYFNGITHLPLFDVENHPNGFIVNLVRPVGPAPKLFWDDSKIAGGTTNLTGCSSASGCHSWSGTKAPNGITAAKDWGDNRTINTWWYANIITANVSFNVSGNISVDANTLNPPSVTTNDTTICDNTPSFNLSGAFTTATGAAWSGGGGTFSPDRNNLKAIYTPTALEKTAGKLMLKLTTTGNGACPPVSDSMTIFIKPGPKVTAGAGTSVCENNPQVTLNGTVSVAKGATWSGGAGGTFTPDVNTLKVVYTAPDSVIKSGKVVLTLTSTGNGSCPAATDQLTITYTAAPNVDAGKDTTLCANNAVIKLNASVTKASGGIWTGGAGTFTANNIDLKANYIPSAAEIISGKVTLTLTSNAFGNCTVVKDQMVINIQPTPLVDAGTDISVCSNNAVANLNGLVKFAKGGLWSEGKGIFNPKPDSLITAYTPSASEIAVGKVKLYLTSTGNSNCLAVKDSITIFITPQPSASAGPDKTVCANNAATILGGSFSGASGITWTGALGATGTFVPNANTPGATYTPSSSEIAGSLVALIITTNGNGVCKAIKDTMLILISPAPVINAGADKNICKNNTVITLAGSATNASTTSWTGGTDTYKPNANALGAIYQPTAAEIAQGFIQLTLTGTKSTCTNVTDDVKFTFTALPVISAGVAQTLCANNATVKLNGSFSTASGLTWSGGNGTFTPNATTINATYKPSAAEISSGQLQLKATTTGNGNCNAVADSITVKFTTAPKADAGTDQIVCSNNAADTLKGVITVASGGTWSGGSGAFTPNSSNLNAKYIPTAAEIGAGSVTLTLTSTGNGNCTAVTDAIKLSFSPAPTSKPGAAQTICADNPVATLNGAVTVAKGGIWSGGNGTYTPDAKTLNAKYQPSASEIQAGKASLVLTTTTNGWCNAVANSVVITISQAPIVSAGADQVICGASNSIALNGKITNATGGTWTSDGTGSFSPNANTLNAHYIPSAADKVAKKVSLTLSSSGNGTCLIQTDQMLINFTPVPSINAGPSQIVCTNNLPVKLMGSGSAAKWSGSNGGTFQPDANTLNAEYTPSAAEIAAGKVVLILTTNDPSTACPQLSDQVTITIPLGPKANAGVDQTICGSLKTIDLDGSVNASATGGIWKTTGTGSFTGSATNLKAKYTVSADDKKIGGVSFTLYTLGNGPCSADSDVVTMKLSPEITADAGPDKTVCADITGIHLTGAITIAGGGIWKSSGSGIFTPNATQLDAMYVPSVADTLAKKITLTLSSTGNGLCPQISDDAIISFSPAPTVKAGSDITVCADSSNISLNGAVTIATGGIWTSDGKGKFSPNAFVLKPTYYIDSADIAKGKVLFTLTSDGNGNCNAHTKQVTLTINSAPVSTTGGNQKVCADVNQISLNGKITTATGGLWKSSGSGSFVPTAASAVSAYMPSVADKKAGLITLTLSSTGNGLCYAVASQTQITITPAPLVNAGPDQTVCADAAAISLKGNIVNAAGGLWSSGGTGTFSPDNTALSATYNPSSSDNSSGKVSLFLTSTGNGNCKPVTDTILIIIKPIPIVKSGSDQVICADSAQVKLSGSVSNAGGGLWTSSGSGNFYANASSVNANYVPSAADVSKGNITLVLSSTSNGTCLPVSDTLMVRITPAPAADAGSDALVCADIISVSLLGKVIVAGGGAWSTSGTGKFMPDSLQLNAGYVPSAADKAVGKVVLSLTTRNNGNCKIAKAWKNIQLVPMPLADAGSDQKICADLGSITLNGKIKQAGGAHWTSDGSGIFSPDANSLSPAYNLSTADKAKGRVNILLTTTGNGVCNAVTDTMLLAITPLPVVSAGADQTMCADANSASLTGMVTVASGGLWTTSGTGKFSPNANTLKALYIPSPADKIAGNIKLTLTSSGNGSCQPVSDELVITITPAPTIDAGADQSVCADFEGAPLSAVKTVAGGILWKSSGTGSFSPDATTSQAIYSASVTDIASGNVTLSATTTGNGTCKAVSDQLQLTISKQPAIDAGPDIMVCPDAVNIQLNAVITGAGGGVWSTYGDGNFNASGNVNSTLLNDIYHPSAAEVAIGSVKLQLVTTGNGSCNFLTDEITISFSGVPKILAGPDKTVCNTNLPIVLEGSGTTGNWSGGNGTFSPDNTSLNASYLPNAGEIASGNVKLYITSTSSGTCAPTKDSVLYTIIAGPVAQADADQTICANAAKAILNGNIQVASGGNWTTSGNGIFQSTNTGNSSQLNDTYIPSDEEISAGKAKLLLTTTGNMGCQEVKDEMLVLINPAPTVSAGNDETVCADLNQISLNGQVTNAGGIKWTRTGTGSFANDIDINNSYTISPADRTSGSVQIILSSTGNGKCLAVSDTMQLGITPLPVSSPGSDQLVCADTKSVLLAGNVSNAGGGAWSGSGSGIFSPNSSSLNAIYIPSTSDTAAKTINLTLITSGNGTCVAVSKSVKITFAPVPLVEAGSDITVCADIKNISLHGQFANAAGALWSGSGTGLFVPGKSDPNATYQPSAADRQAGGVIMTYTSQGSSVCANVADYQNILITPMPVAAVNAGLDQIVCADVSGVFLDGTVKVASGGIWTTGGSGKFIPDPTALHASYQPSTSDIAAKNVRLILTTVGNGLCNPVSDTMLVTILPAPVTNPGNNTTVCADTSGIKLNGKILNALGGMWSGTGSGFFAPGPDQLNATYIPSAADIQSGKIGLTLTSTGNGTCNAAMAGIIVNITKKPTVDGGGDQTICAGTLSTQLNGSKTVAKGIVWTSSGTGTFLPDEFTANAAYEPSEDDKNNGAVSLKIMTTVNGSCKPVSDDLLITILPDPLVNAGTDQTVCADTAILPINAKVKNATGVTWKTNGSGAFSPGANTMNSAYQPSASDAKNGKIQLIAFSTGNGSCAAASDTIIISMLPQPVAYPDSIVLCTFEDGAGLKGKVVNAGGGLWHTSGSGTFSPNEFSLQARYFPSAADILQENVDLTLTTTGNGICKAASELARLAVTPQPLADAGMDEFVCRNAAITLIGKPVSNASYQWKLAGSTTGTATDQITVTIPATSQYVLVLNNRNGCVSTDTMTVAAIDPPKFSMSDHFCYSDSLIVYAYPSALPPFNGLFQWYRNTQTLSGEDRSNITPAADGKYTIQYSYGKCAADTSTLITNPPYLKTPDLTGCIGRFVKLRTSVINPATYQWTWKNKISADSIVALKDTNYYQVAVTEKAYGCMSVDQMKIIGIEIPRITLTPNSICSGDSIVLSAKPHNAYPVSYVATYSWKLDDIDLNNHTDSLTASGKGNYSVTVMVAGCDTTAVSALILNPVPPAITERTKEFCSNSDAPVVLEASKGTDLKYLWEATKDTSRTTSVTTEGTYYVVMTNAFNCVVKDSIVLKEICPPVVYIPTGFIPGSKDENGTFQIFGKDFTNYKLIIFNRWGEIIFVSTNKNVSWDGTYRGEPMPMGSYPYLITYNGVARGHTEAQKKEGQITIIR